MKKYRHSLGVYSDSCDSSHSLSSDEEWIANAVKIYGTEECRGCDTSKACHVFGALSCGHLIPHVDMPVNAVNTLEGRNVTHPCLVKGKRADMIGDTGASWIGVNEHLVSIGEYTGQYVRCRLFCGTKERYPLCYFARIEVC